MTGRPAPPYYSQWESPSMARALIAGVARASHDPRWAASGAATAEEYEYWSWRVCGMACLRMVLAARGVDPPPTVTLARAVLEAGGYRIRTDGGLDGLIYTPFTAYLGEVWGVEATVAAPLATSEIDRAVDAGALVMASVSPMIRCVGLPPPSRGGHLVLVHDRTDEHLVVHNPSGDSDATQRSAMVPRAYFDACFAGRGVVILPPPQR